MSGNKIIITGLEDTSEYRREKDGLIRLVECFDDIAKEHRTSILLAYHDTFGADDVLTPPLSTKIIRKAGDVGTKPTWSLRLLIARYLLRWVYELIEEERGTASLRSLLLPDLRSTPQPRDRGEQSAQKSHGCRA